MTKILKNRLLKVLFAIFFILALLFTRFYNLDQTSRYSRDESSDLVKMHQYFVDHTITLVGPIDNTGTKVFGSITYYLLLPFGILGNFDPVSPIYGTAFYGVLAVVILILITKKLNKKFILPIALLSLTWFPLIESSRWAWNPHLIPFWISLAILFYLMDKKWSYFLVGIFSGLAFHQHYIAFFAGITFVSLISIQKLRQKQFVSALMPVLGFLVTFIPFAMFDLRHPPGLFFSKYLSHNELSGNFLGKTDLLFSNFRLIVWDFLKYVTILPVFAVINGVLIVILLWNDIRRKSSGLLFIVPVFAQFFGTAYAVDYQNRYVLPGLIFFLTWISFPRSKTYTYLAVISIALMCFGSLTVLKSRLTLPLSEPNISIVRDATKHMSYEIHKLNIKNVNVAALDSPDHDPLGTIYRDTLLVGGDKLNSQYDYFSSDYLFVVTYATLANLRTSQDTLMYNFKGGQLLDEDDIDANWKIYLLSKNK